jgi:hypothetical protein
VGSLGIRWWQWECRNTVVFAGTWEREETNDLLRKMGPLAVRRHSFCNHHDNAFSSLETTARRNNMMQTLATGATRFGIALAATVAFCSIADDQGNRSRDSPQPVNDSATFDLILVPSPSTCPRGSSASHPWSRASSVSRSHRRKARSLYLGGRSCGCPPASSASRHNPSTAMFRA